MRAALLRAAFSSRSHPHPLPQRRCVRHRAAPRASGAMAAATQATRIVIVPGNGCDGDLEDLRSANFYGWAEAQFLSCGYEARTHLPCTHPPHTHTHQTCHTCHTHARAPRDARAAFSRPLSAQVRMRPMPDPLYAKESVWCPFIKDVLRADEHAVLIGHSSGAGKEREKTRARAPACLHACTAAKR
jgi:hypothetical protein